MELIFAIVILFFLFGGWQELTKPAQAKKYLYTKVIKKSEKDHTAYEVHAEGKLPNPWGMHLVGALYIYDEEANLPCLSNFTQTDESQNSRVYRSDINFGYVEMPGNYFPNWSPLAGVILEGIHHPHKGNRELNFTIYYYDYNDPPIFQNGDVISGRTKIFHISESKVHISFDEPGFMDEIKNENKVKPLIIEVAVAMAMSDGSLDKSEGNVIKHWIKKELSLVNDSKRKAKLKKTLNDSLETSYKKISEGKSFGNAIKKINENASKTIKYQVIELCLDILSADGVAEEGELKLLKDLSLKLGLDYEEVQKMKEKTLLKVESSESASDESLIGLDESLSKENKLKFINKEYKKWNGRLNSLSTGEKKENAQRMLEVLSKLRRKYEK